MSASEAESHRQTACVEYVKNCAIPIVGIHDDRAWIFGTSALFIGDGVSCLVTARHVIDELNRSVTVDKMVLPVPHRALPGFQRDVNGIGEFTEAGCPTIDPGAVRDVRPPDRSEDICAIVLLSEDVVSQLSRSYNSVDDSFFLAEGAEVENYYIAGYPRGARLDRDGETGYRFYHYCPRKLSAVPEGVLWEPPADPDVNLFFEPPNNILNQYGKPIKEPDLAGLSGSLVWAELPESQDAGLWRPQRQMRVAGLQTSCSESRRIVRATRATTIRSLLASIPPSKDEL